MKNYYWWVIGIVLFIIGIFVFVQNPTVTNQPGQGQSGTGVTEVLQDNVKEFTIEGKPFSFTPNELRVNKGDKVIINFKNLEGTHDWGVDEFNVRTKQIQAGQTDRIEFIADKTGIFEYYCSVGNGYHRQQGMVGKLIVE